MTPIKSLSYRAKQIAEGNLAVERMNIKRKDEIGGLNESFNQMTDQLISLIQEISHVSSQVESFSVQLDDENKSLWNRPIKCQYRQTKWRMVHKRFQKTFSMALV